MRVPKRSPWGYIMSETDILPNKYNFIYNIDIEVTLRDRITKGSIRQASAEELLRLLLILYRRQTLSEQRDGFSREQNGVGFSKFDVPLLTSIAEWGQSRGYLTPKQVEVVRRRLGKYVRQLNSYDDTESAQRWD